MEEQLISFETAKLANEKGLKHPISKLNLIACDVTQSLLQKRLREEHDIHVYCITDSSSSCGYYCIVEGDIATTNNLAYEEALEAGLKQGLKLI